MKNLLNRREPMMARSSQARFCMCPGRSVCLRSQLIPDELIRPQGVLPDTETRERFEREGEGHSVIAAAIAVVTPGDAVTRPNRRGHGQGMEVRGIKLVALSPFP